MINNRQGGRRRGRGGQRTPNTGGGQSGNRQDTRQRGNATQLLEKYKNMARDSQLAGDRVQTEYYLQYADHYFRVLGEGRSRFEDQRPRRGDDMDEDEGDEEMADGGDGDSSGGDERDDRNEQPERPNPRARNDRDRNDRGDRERAPSRYARDDRSGEDEQRPPARPRMNGNDDSLPLDVLPPAIGADSAASLPVNEPAAPARPRRRARVSRPADGEDDSAPVA